MICHNLLLGRCSVNVRNIRHLVEVLSDALVVEINPRITFVGQHTGVITLAAFLFFR